MTLVVLILTYKTKLHSFPIVSKLRAGLIQGNICFHTLESVTMRCQFHIIYSMVLVHEMMRIIGVKPASYMELEQFDEGGDPMELRCEVTVDFGIDTLAYYLLEDCAMAVVEPENLIAKVAILYLNVRPPLVNRFLQQQQAVSSFKEV